MHKNIPPRLSTDQPINQSTDRLINQSTNQLITYTLHLADNTLVLGQRNAEWTGHGPILEQDIAISNIALDLVGQARNFYQYAAMLINQAGGEAVSPPATEDSLAFLRNAPDFTNCLLVELPKGDWAVTVLRQFLFSSWQFYLYQQLQDSKDTQLAAIAQKSVKEVAYHVRWSAEWVIRLGDGTEESHARLAKALAELWPYTFELTTNTHYEMVLLQQGIAADNTTLQEPWMQKIKEVLAAATLQAPENQLMHTGGKQGNHTAHLAVMLEEMQYLQRTYPGAEW